jgi:hypothetical protein
MKIYKNLYTSYDEYFIQAESDRTYSYGYIVSRPTGEWKLRGGQFYISDILDETHFPIVGEIDIDSVVSNAVLNAVKKEDETVGK